MLLPVLLVLVEKWKTSMNEYLKLLPLLKIHTFFTQTVVKEILFQKNNHTLSAHKCSFYLLLPSSGSVSALMIVALTFKSTGCYRMHPCRLKS